MEVLRLRLADIDLDKQPWLRGDSLLSSPGFLGLWKAEGGTPVCLAVVENGAPIAALPGIEFGRFAWRRFQAAPHGCYARLLNAPDHEHRRPEAADAILTFLAEAPYARAIIYDFHHHFDEHEDFDSRVAATRLVDIDADWQPPDRKLRQQIRRAIRDGCNVEEFDAGRHLDGFMELMKLTTARTGHDPGLSRSFFERLAELARRDRRVRWTWFDDDDGRPVASNVFLVEQDQLLHWQACYDPSYSRMQPNKWVPWLMIRQVLKEGVSTFNLGASPAGAEGVDEYKRKWGGGLREYRCLIRSRGLGKIK